MWFRKMEWLLGISDSILELVPSIQQFPGGGTDEVMAKQLHCDLCLNLPFLKKPDAVFIRITDGFHDTDFWYVDRGIISSEGDDCDSYPSGIRFCRPSVRQVDKWWLPCPKVPPKGLSNEARKRLQQWGNCTNQMLKAALAINSNVLAEMETRTAYLETLPKSGLDCLDLQSAHHTLKVENRTDAAVHVWRLKDQKKHPHKGKSKSKSWGGKVKGLVADGDKNQYLADQAETLLHSLRLCFPGLPQTALDMNKIQYNKGVGHSLLESYSRVMESLEFNIIARIDDVLYVDDAAKCCAAAVSMSLFKWGGLDGLVVQKLMSPSPYSTPCAFQFATPTFCLSPLIGSPGNAVSPPKACPKVPSVAKLVKVTPIDLDKLWSYVGTLVQEDLLRSS